ncbi:GIN domain-containing protein [Pseudoduganella sp. UC29_106]|uniref:GIN domain-containing protein n=1 Tax=Pseudoduganella sp. UC29_106 TaxID=3374553 RepID=UPI003756D51F
MRLTMTIAALAILGGCVIVVPDGHSKYGWSSSESIKGNGSSATETRNVAGTTALRIENRRSVDMDVEVRIGGPSTLTVDGDSNLLPLVHTDVEGDTLKVWTDADLRSSGPIRVVFTAPRLRELSSTGSVRVDVNGLNGGALRVSHTGSGHVIIRGRLDDLDLNHTGSGFFAGEGLESRSAHVNMVGSGRIDVGVVRGDALRVNSTGSGGLQGRGAVRQLDVQAQGSGRMYLTDLRAEVASLSSSGSGGIDAYVSQKVEAHGSGSGSIQVSGNPAERNLSGRRTSVQ